MFVFKSYMPVQKLFSMIIAPLALLLGNSFPAKAAPREKDPKACEAALTSGFKLAAAIDSEGASGMAWSNAENSLWLVTVNKDNGSVKLYEPLRSNLPNYKWHNLRVSQDSGPQWSADPDSRLQLIIGAQAMEMNFLTPARVRIMPVGGFHPADGRIQKIFDENGEEISISAQSGSALTVKYASGRHAALSFELAGQDVENFQVSRGENQILILLRRINQAQSMILSLRDGVLAPLAVGPASYLFRGPQGHFVTWTEAAGSANQFALKAAPLDSLTAPQLSFPLEPGEVVLGYASPTGSELHEFLGVLTSRRILLFRNSSH